MRIFSLIPLALATLAACAPATPSASPPAPSAAAQDSTVIFLVRHAEKGGVAGEADPVLSAAGEARARALADVLRASGIDEIIVTQYRRTGATAAPIASALGIVPDTFSTRAQGHPDAVAAAARAHRGKTVLVVGHSNSIPAIITALGAGPMANLCEAEYSHLFVVVLKDGTTPRLERRTYGEPDPPGASNCPR
jgi:broad specificity phosphatase PhoE